jgi:hypothetical protein
MIFFQLFTSASTLYGLSLFISAACGLPVLDDPSAGALIVFIALSADSAVVVTISCRHPF